MQTLMAARKVLSRLHDDMAAALPVMPQMQTCMAKASKNGAADAAQAAAEDVKQQPAAMSSDAGTCHQRWLLPHWGRAHCIPPPQPSHSCGQTPPHAPLDVPYSTPWRLHTPISWSQAADRLIFPRGRYELLSELASVSQSESDGETCGQQQVLTGSAHRTGLSAHGRSRRTAGLPCEPEHCLRSRSPSTPPHARPCPAARLPCMPWELMIRASSWTVAGRQHQLDTAVGARVFRQHQNAQTSAALHIGRRSRREPAPQRRLSLVSHHHSLSNMAGFPAHYTIGHTNLQMHHDNGIHVGR